MRELEHYQDKQVLESIQLLDSLQGDIHPRPTVVEKGKDDGLLDVDSPQRATKYLHPAN